ncbi:STAS domain-containing protein [Streptacidiphilus carbonis]|uniref:STAS domain-containing protein n=1 Tax=Streptacidiphilus carbonis TaxID=105422 RepID=UPI0005A7F837|nr:STAS domain-containing protein [Streptacidiphilus carbonis]
MSLESVLTLRLVDDGHAVAQLHGALDMDTTVGLCDALGGAVDTGHRHLVLDMSGVDFCDSTGLNMIVLVRRHVAERHGTLVMAGVGELVQRVLDITGVGTVIPQYPDVEQALAHTPD